MEYFVDGSNYFLILEYLPYNLFVIIESFLGLLGEAEIKGLMVQLLQGVAANHSTSILHRDLKPTNLLVANDGTLKIADFGQARKIGVNCETIRSRAEAKESDQDSAMSLNSTGDNLQKEKHLAKLDLPTKHPVIWDGRFGEQLCPSREEDNRLEGKDGNVVKETGQFCAKKVGELLEENNSITESNFDVGFYSQNYDDKKRAETAILGKVNSRFHKADNRSHGNAIIDGYLSSEKIESVECLNHSLSERTLEVDFQIEDFCHHKNAYHGLFCKGGNSSFPSEEHLFMEEKSELAGKGKGFGPVRYTRSVQKLAHGTVLKVKRTGNKPFANCGELFTKCSKNLSEPSDFEHSASVDLDVFLYHSYNSQNVEKKLIGQGDIASQIRGCELNGSIELNTPGSTGTSEGEHTGNTAAAFEDECVMDLPARNAKGIHYISTDTIDCDGLFLLDLSKDGVKLNDQDCKMHYDPQTPRQGSGEVEIVESSTPARFDLDGIMDSQQGIAKIKLGSPEAQVHAVSWSGALENLSKVEGTGIKLSKRKNVEGDTLLGTQNLVKSQEHFLGSNFSNEKIENCLVGRDNGDIGRFFNGGYANQVTEHGRLTVAESEEEWGILEAGDEDFLPETGNEAKWYDCEDVLKEGNYSSWFGDLTSVSKDYVVRKVSNELKISERYCELTCDGSWLGHKSENHCSSVICSPVTHSGYIGSDKRLHISEIECFQSNSVSVDDADDIQIQDDRLKPVESDLSSTDQRFKEASLGKKDGNRGFPAFDGVYSFGSRPSLQPDEREESILSVLDPRLNGKKRNGLDCTHNQDGVQFLDNNQGYDDEEEGPGPPVVSPVEKDCQSIGGSVISQGVGQAFPNQFCCCSLCLEHPPNSSSQMASRNKEKFQDLTWNMYSSCKPPLSGQTSNATEGSLLELTGCVGTRWYRAPELLYGCTSYGTGIDLWAVGCIFGELLAGQPLFPGSTDIDQLSRVIKILGVPKEENWPGVSKLADYNKISFDDNCVPLGLEEILPSASEASRKFLSKLFVYDPEKRLSAEEALKDEYFLQDPLPVLPQNFPALTERQSLGQEDWHEWKEPCSSSSDFEVLDFAGY
ncbi:hypothetical protein O6H91_07G110700 [Diphasiastrum complanatum]|nr:hypothetical protein O6H91_07G110700 [Diphasiastrum complanatum]